MASIFNNPFFSIAGQVERIQNVGATLNAAFNPFAKVKGVSVTEDARKVLPPAVTSILETAASHPYVTAGIVAGGITLASNPSAVAALM